MTADPLEALAERRTSNPAAAGRPFVTLAYAQSLDGSIAAPDGRPLALSSPDSLLQTHRLRADHDGVLVGIGTVLSDDPQLTVRLVPGDQPQPVIVDTHLRTPAAARVFGHPRRPWIAAAEPFAVEPSRALHGAGAELLGVRQQHDGRLDLAELLESLGGRGLSSLLVEGGSRILHSFLAGHLVDWVVVTVAPRFVAGRPALIGAPNGGLPGLRSVGMTPCGPDFLLWGEPSWPAV